MKVRHKLLIVMALLIIFMGSVYFGVTYTYMMGMFHQYTEAIKIYNTKPWAEELTNYYEANHHSWIGVKPYMVSLLSQQENPQGRWLKSLTLYDSQKKILIQMGKENKFNSLSVPIMSEDRQVATLIISVRKPPGLSIVEEQTVRTMIIGTVIAIMVTSLVALGIGAWLARIITKPLHSIIEAMQRMRQGNLQARLPITTRDEFGKVAHTFNLMAERLFRTEQARSHLVADVAHELRTPLTIIQGQLELIQQGIKPAEPSTLLPIQDEVARLTILVQDLHQLSLAEVGQLPLEKIPTDLVQLLSNLVEMYRLEAEERNIQLQLVNHTTSPLVQVDPNRMAQVFVNLITNALRYTRGEITIQFDATPQHLIAKVIDNGEGIPEKHLPYIFNRFYRADDDRARHSGGTGLGLAIAKEFVESHGGSISVTSQVNQGTTFTVSIPLTR